MQQSSRTSSRVQYLICGSPNDAFYSQIAFFRRSLDAQGDCGRAASVVAVFGADDQPPIPARWRPHFANIEVHHADPAEFRRTGFYAASDLRFRLIDATADISIICDADTALLRPLPADFLDDMKREPAIAAVVAQYPFYVSIDGRPRHGPEGLYPGMRAEDGWRSLSQFVLGRPIDLDYEHPIRGTGPHRSFRRLPPGPLRTRLRTATALARNRNRRTNERIPAPLYPNYGFIASTPALLGKLFHTMDELLPTVAGHIGNPFDGQAAIALAIEKAGLPKRSLPFRYNFPNLAIADEQHPDEIEHIILIHYMNTKYFDRHTVFAGRQAFDEFLTLGLRGSNAAFQRHVMSVTGGEYPFD